MTMLIFMFLFHCLAKPVQTNSMKSRSKLYIFLKLFSNLLNEKLTEQNQEICWDVVAMLIATVF